MHDKTDDEKVSDSGWVRQTPLDAVSREQLLESWSFRGRRYPIDVTVGKKLDVLSLKGTSTDEVRRYAAFLKSVSDRLYSPGAPARLVEACPCCSRAAGDARVAMRVFSGTYVQCRQCGHVFVRSQPSMDALSDLFQESAGHSAEYTDADHDAQTLRIQQISKPKLDWAVRQFIRLFGRTPASAVDVGAGGGHFVAAARQEGLDAIGYEKSAPSRTFARKAFGIDLIDDDFLTVGGENSDLVTFWGLLEYVPEPRRFLAAARKGLPARHGMLIVEVPRFNCVGSAVQSMDGAVVARHMDPTSHVNCFTDASLCTALVEEGFNPVAAWYFGMDAYELLIQASLKLHGDSTLEALAGMVNPIQARLDSGRQCDDLIVAAVPAD